MRNIFAVFILLIFLLRIATLNSIALMDSTEGRYASIAQHMATSGDWITPMVQQRDELVPYLGKPPLYFWVAALSIDLFGSHEWTARLPSLLAAILSCSLLFLFARQFLTRPDGYLACLIGMSSIFMFFIAGGAVIDFLLATFVMGAIVAWAIATDEFTSAKQRRYWGLAFFIWCALGFLTKGPVALIFSGAPLAIWSITQRSYRRWLRIPWIAGLILFAIITLPWFIIAERANPGFLNYFFVNENFLRFVTKNYQDRFGTGHVQPYGSIWVAFLLGSAPWIFLAPFLWIHGRKSIDRGILRTLLMPAPARADSVNQRQIAYVLLMAWSVIIPGLFFTVARQITGLYIMPAMAPCALVLAWSIRSLSERSPAGYMRLAAISNATLKFICVLLWLILPVAMCFGISSGSLLWMAILAASSVYIVRLADKLNWVVLHRVAACACSLAILFTSIIIGITPILAAERSTKIILADIVDHKGTEKFTVGIPVNKFGNPFSPWFYDENSTGTIFYPVSFDEDNLSTAPNIIILQTRSIESQLSNIKTNGFEIRAKRGRWTWLERVAVKSE